ncbi:YbgC/FadM family acyl-CoA thioesterase [Helicobacter turcicus]|uniref:YbgC/FadM family acyl-CoA thioesterase n=1 Tax=Helicobacter turcicus TaxID=2867412 RepID=A0ABS7JLJ0_9HELI|nr:YbgC/FadM family acyl-CoA thioesterase [Helicobacter turcicus]MBX7490265.1 YbgC/FadM family acyl-CoA thioesterase [Helicobacter turcicus]MBX7545156.1 YbgC/FadM family acyl-CoA thioesterase [Helicobacter turcicus]
MQIRVFYEDTDCGGIVYHSNYLKFCERARSEVFFQAGIPPLNDGIGFVVKDMHIEFLYPAKLGDILEVKTKLIAQKSASLKLAQNIYLQDKEVFRAQLTLVCLDVKTQKITKIPLWAENIFKSL